MQANRRERPVSPCALVIFGASGDLTQRKLVPALYNLYLDGHLPESFAVVGVARRKMGAAEFVAAVRAGIAEHSRQPLDPARWEELAKRISYVEADTVDPAAYARLKAHLERIDAEHGTAGNRLFYLATPPSAFAPIVEQLGQAGLNRPSQPEARTRVVVEKPIGHDLASALALNRTLNAVFHERDVFRIDHYLGKETVQNLLVFRFANAIFEPLWNQKYVDHVQITVAESLGVEGRGSYYEEAGTTRDMVQNHVFQLLCLIAMEPPVSLDADAIRNEKVKVLQALRPIEPAQAATCSVRGQYGPGVIDNEQVPGYRAEPGVAPESRTETYVALRQFVDNWRWAGVPFYVRAGKRLAKRVTEVALQFRDVPHRLFRTPPAANTLALRIQPGEEIQLSFDAKEPGSVTRIVPVAMDFRYGESFDKTAPEAYERLLLDAINGDPTLFIRRDEVEAAWSAIDRLEQGWATDGGGRALPEYTAGTWGPADADVLLARDGRTWRRP
ncbi:MAG TPA: glucose-6-phosphate dehydrogenase [Candidatus Polarisedimenticolaceae bacterium]|nr:glucose-6-phosphate dehydrogenase [Candidatus Polarisedimenticolaceae bacterium]